MNTVHTYSAILLEIDRAEQLHPKWPDDLVHAVAIVSEEAGELVRAANRVQFEEASMGEVIDEAVQVGAMVFRLLKNIDNARGS